MKKILILLMLLISLPIQAQDITNKLGGTTANETYDVTDSADKILLRVQGDGQVGIGTNIPSEVLDVDGSIAVSGTVDGIDIATAVTANTAKVTDDDDGVAEVYGSGWNGDTDSPTKNDIYDKIQSLPSGADNLGNHNATQDINMAGFEINLNGGYVSGDGDNEGIYVDSDGNVGIGTASPLSKLSIGASGYADATLYSLNTLSIGYGIYIENATSGIGIYSEAASGGYSGYFDGPFYVGGNIGLGTTDFGGGDGIIAIHNALTNPTATLSNAAALYASGGELWAYDVSGNTTQLSPHDSESGEWVFYSKNTITGRVVKINMEKLVKKIEEITGESFMEEWVED